MAIQTIFQAGNSPVISIPRELFKEVDLKIGQAVRVERLGDSHDIVVRTSPVKKHKKSGVSKEFRVWMDKFLEEDKDLLIELSHR